MKTYDTIQMLRRLAFGATLLTATALLPACDDDPAALDEELTTDPGTSVPKPCVSSVTIFSRA